MWSRVALVGLFFPTVILGLDRLALQFSVDYFRYRNDKFICLLTCGKDTWTRDFARQAAKYNARVSVCKTDDSLNKASLRACLQHTFVSVGVLASPACPQFEEVVYYVSENTLFDSKHQWLIIDNAENSSIDNNGTGESWRRDITPAVKIIGKLNISVDADISLAVQGPNNFALYELYNFGKIQGGDLIIENSGTWSAEGGIVADLNEYKYYRRWNFNQWPMRLITVVSKPEQFDPKYLTDRLPSPGVATISRTATTILSDIAEIHRIRFVYSVADRWVGEYSLNKSKAMAATALYFKQQDITPVLRYIGDIHTKVDFIYPPITSIETKYFYRIPTYGVGKLENQFLRPLSTGTWLLVIVVIILCACVLLLSAKLERRPSAGQYATFSVIASLCQQFFEDNAVGTVRVSGARKLTILVTGVSCVLIYNYYTSSVVSWLLNGPPPSINSLQELLESPLDLIFEDIGYTRSWMQSPDYYYNKRNAKVEDEIRKKKVFNKKNRGPLLMPVEEGIKLVKAGGFAYHTEVETANRLIARTFTKYELCELGSLQSMEKTLLYACLQKNSPYTEFFAWSILRLYERGIVKCIQHRTNSPTVKSEGSCPRALALGGAAPAFLLLAAGFFLATIIMFVERAIWKRKKVVFKQQK
ncbi:hypothetical protein ABMA27_014421 [Loxostege sticticalis]|uniref:Ionotropic receptor 75a N-terminal domain-containing protein n=1 Tax=Loxostege sticticalis TaxID=481309 RepID=A0ABR3I8Y9_LOXSC